MGIDETRRRRARARLPVRASKKGDPKGGKREASRGSLVYRRFSAAMMPSKASCGVIRSGSGEPWFDRKNEAGEMYGIHGGELDQRRKSFLPY